MAPPNKQSFGRFQCTYCQENISGLRIRCVECDQFDLCLQCFSCGAEIGKHKNDHKYKFMDPGNFSLFGCEGWTAREDVRLLDAIEQYGYGNWVDIAKHIETRTPDEAQERYVLYYVNGNLGTMTLTDPSLSDSDSPALPAVVDHTCDINGALSSSLSSRMPPLQLEPLQIAQLNYMPLRDDFEREHDNNSEQLVSQLNVGSVEDEDVDIGLKLALVDMYFERLRERARRKRMARDYQLPEVFFDELRKDTLLQMPGGGRMPRRKKDRTPLAEKLRVLGQFLTRAEFERFHKNLQVQRDLLQRVRELIRYRRQGITRVEECIEYERAKMERERSDPSKKVNKRRKAKFVYNRLKVRKSRYWRFILAQRALLDEQRPVDDFSSEFDVGVSARH
nr:Ada2B-like protein [Parasacculina yatsui]